MPYKVEIADTDPNNKFLSNLPKNILPKIAGHLKLLGEHPFLGRSVEAPISAYIYSFSIKKHAEQDYRFTVAYKINEGNETILITELGVEISRLSQ